MELKEKALAELGPNEKVVWIAQPVTAIVFRRSLGYFVASGFVVLLSLYFLAMASQESIALTAPNPQVPPAQSSRPKEGRG